MSDLAARWYTANDNYLALTLEWLRLLLQRQGRTAARAEPPTPDQELDAEIASAAARMHEASAFEPPPAIVHLAQRFGLSEFETQILLLCAAMELDTRVPELCARAQDDRARACPTFALALSIFERPAWEALSPERPLRYWRLLEVHASGVLPLTGCPLRADERIVNYIKGLDHLDERIVPLVVALDRAPLRCPAPASQLQTIEAIERYIEQTAKVAAPRPIQLVGPDPSSKLLVAREIAQRFGLRLYRMAASALPNAAVELEALARLWQRESMLTPIALFVDGVEGPHLGAEASASGASTRAVSRLRGVVFVDARDALRLDGADADPIPPLVVDIDRPTPQEQLTTWSSLLGERVAPDLPGQLAGQFNLNLPLIHHIAAQALSANGDDSALSDALWRTCQRHTRPQLDLLAQRLDTKARWDDLVLPDESKDILRHIADQVGHRSQVYGEWGFRRRLNRGLGISALFAGETGTGKTMAAEVLANELKLNLYRIDLSAVVSKYIGETETNLRRLFDAAENGGAILFFDEADALFGARSEVKDSHDRYANIEINYLLQRIESYCGLAILATNMKQAIDSAFMRRLRFVVTFAFPRQAERVAMWRQAFPSDTPTGVLDHHRLARLNLTGGSIHTVALNAAFLAARRGSAVTMPLIFEAARHEFHKLERPFNEADLRAAQTQGAGG